MTRGRREENMACSRLHQFLKERPMARDKVDNICIDKGLIPADCGRTVGVH